VVKKNKIDNSELMDWLEGKLDPAMASAIARAVETDPVLKANADWLREFLNLSAAAQLATPDPVIHQAATERFEAYARGKRRSDPRQTLRALLTSDSWQRLSLAGARQVTLQSAPRQLIYSTPLADIALNVQGYDEHLHLYGQVFPTGDEETKFTVQLTQADRSQALTATDTLGKFNFAALAEGQYNLVLTADSYEIEVGPLEMTWRAIE
jgi:hypothetical protein